jgi:hypothetical protein
MPALGLLTPWRWERCARRWGASSRQWPRDTGAPSTRIALLSTMAAPRASPHAECTRGIRASPASSRHALGVTVTVLSLHSRDRAIARHDHGSRPHDPRLGRGGHAPVGADYGLNVFVSNPDPISPAFAFRRSPTQTPERPRVSAGRSVASRNRTMDAVPGSTAEPSHARASGSSVGANVRMVWSDSSQDSAVNAPRATGEAVKRAILSRDRALPFQYSPTTRRCRVLGPASTGEDTRSLSKSSIANLSSHAAQSGSDGPSRCV